MVLYLFSGAGKTFQDREEITYSVIHGVKTMKDKAEKSYFYNILCKYLSIYILPDDSVVEVDPPSDALVGLIRNRRSLSLNGDQKAADSRSGDFASVDGLRRDPPDYYLLNGSIQYERDIHTLLGRLHELCSSSTRVIITYYSSLWKPLINIATSLGLRKKTIEQNWIASEDIANMLFIADFEPVLRDSKVLCPVYIPVLSNLLNRYIAPLPIFRAFCLVNILVARPVFRAENGEFSVSVIVPARNEAGNIENIVKRLPSMGTKMELIFIEGGSSDTTWDKIVEVEKSYGRKIGIKIGKQEGRGKGDAVRKGFSMASNDILMILDADMTVSPEELPFFYEAIKKGKGEFINGSRLVYPMEEMSMNFCNMIANKFFAMAFSYTLGQPFKDTLCGTKVLLRSNYLKIAVHRGYFGEFDPFGDFDLIFGASRLGLKITEMPVRYKERVYGRTNISRWRHGWLLLRMLAYAATKMKFV